MHRVSPDARPPRDEPWWTWVVAVFAGVVAAQVMATTGWPVSGWAARSAIAAVVVVAAAQGLPRAAAWVRA